MRNIILLILTLCGWFALIAQFAIMYQLHVTSLPEMFARFFTYFTILTNIIVAVCATFLLLAPASAAGRFFGKYASLTAITVYILVVGLIYNVILRFQWQPTGLQKLVDELLHSVVPALFVVYWCVFVKKQQLKPSALFTWLLYPLTYMLIIFLRGKMSGYYPYSFIDVATIGFNKAIQNSFIVAAVFALLSLLFIMAGNAVAGRNRGSR